MHLTGDLTLLSKPATGCALEGPWMGSSLSPVSTT